MEEKRSLMNRFKSFCVECRRVWQVTRKPSREELKMIVKVTGLGILAIGAVGFLIHALWVMGFQ